MRIVKSKMLISGLARRLNIRRRACKGRKPHDFCRVGPKIGKLAVDNNRRNASDAIVLRPFRVFLLVHVKDLNITG